MRKWQDELETGRNHRRAQRVCSLWGELWNDVGLLARAEAALKRVVLLRRRVLALKDTTLYRTLGGGQRTIHLRMTNVLIHDDIYRSIAHLWQVWERHATTGEEDAQRRWDRDQEGARAFSRFGALVVVRACQALGMEPYSDDLATPFQVGASIRLDGPAGPVVLRWAEDLGVALEPVGGRCPLRVVALPAVLEASRRADAWLNSLEGESLLVLYVAAEKVRVEESTLERLRGPGPRRRAHVLAPVAPWELASVERVARAIRWYLWDGLLRAYPVTVPLPAGWKDRPIPPAWVRLQASALQVVEPPRGARSWPELEQRARALRAAADKQVEALAAMDPHDPRKARDRLHLRKQCDDAVSAAAQCEQVLKDYEQAIDRTRDLLRCPVCHGRTTPYGFEHADGRSFRVACGDCHASWGLRTCNSCDGEFPFLSTPGHMPRVHAHDVDSALGCDVLAFPLGDDVFLCSLCGERSDGESSTAC